MKRWLIFVFILIIIFFVLNIEHVKSKSVEYSTKATVTVNPIYSLDIEIEILEKNMGAGEKLPVLIELKKTDLTSITKEIEVRLDYEILKKKGKEFEVITRGDVGSLNVTNEAEKAIEIQIPSDIKAGKYILKIKASHPQAYGDEDEDSFFVRKKIFQDFSLHSLTIEFDKLITFLLTPSF